MTPHDLAILRDEVAAMVDSYADWEACLPRWISDLQSGTHSESLLGAGLGRREKIAEYTGMLWVAKRARHDLEEVLKQIDE